MAKLGKILSLSPPLAEKFPNASDQGNPLSSMLGLPLQVCIGQPETVCQKHLQALWNDARRGTRVSCYYWSNERLWPCGHRLKKTKGPIGSLLLLKIDYAEMLAVQAFKVRYIVCLYVRWHANILATEINSNTLQKFPYGLFWDDARKGIIVQ